MSLDEQNMYEKTFMHLVVASFWKEYWAAEIKNLVEEL